MFPAYYKFSLGDKVTTYSFQHYSPEQLKNLRPYMVTKRRMKTTQRALRVIEYRVSVFNAYNNTWQDQGHWYDEAQLYSFKILEANDVLKGML